MIFGISLIILCISAYVLYKAYCKSKNTNEINKQVEEENEKLLKINDTLTKSRNELENKIQENTAQLHGITMAIQNSRSASEQTVAACQQAYEQYLEVLENHYQKVDI